MKNSNNFDNNSLKDRVKKILKDAKKNNLIKPHTLAFEKYPTQEESHKGNTKYFCNK